jgi:endonuclease/exonuclease/phosphatase family metal-dependent hydrolase
MTKTNGNLAQTVLHSFKNRRARPVVPSGLRQKDGCLTVASYNVHKCVGTDGRFDPVRIREVIREMEPDVLALQEADMRFGERAGLLDLNLLRIETGLVPIPILSKPKSHGWRGNLLLFRQGVVRDVRQVPLPGLEPRGALVAEIELEHGSVLRIIAAHLGLLRWARQLQADTLVKLMQGQEDRPTIIMGDFNEWRLGNRSSLKRFEVAFGPLPPPLPSFPAQLPVLSLDRILSNRKGLIDDIAVHDTPLARTASDHLPISARIDLSAAQSG